MFVKNSLLLKVVSEQIQADEEVKPNCKNGHETASKQILCKHISVIPVQSICQTFWRDTNKGSEPLPGTVVRQTDFDVTSPSDSVLRLTGVQHALFSSNTRHCPTMKSTSLHSNSICMFCPTDVGQTAFDVPSESVLSLKGGVQHARI